MLLIVLVGALALAQNIAAQASWTYLNVQVVEAGTGYPLYGARVYEAGVPDSLRQTEPTEREGNRYCRDELCHESVYAFDAVWVYRRTIHVECPGYVPVVIGPMTTATDASSPVPTWRAEMIPDVESSTPESEMCRTYPVDRPRE